MARGKVSPWPMIVTAPAFAVLRFAKTLACRTRFVWWFTPDARSAIAVLPNVTLVPLVMTVILSAGRLFHPRRHELEIQQISGINTGRRHHPLLREVVAK